MDWDALKKAVQDNDNIKQEKRAELWKRLNEKCRAATVKSVENAGQPKKVRLIRVSKFVVKRAK